MLKKNHILEDKKEKGIIISIYGNSTMVLLLYTKKIGYLEINNHLNSKRILIDGVNGNLNSFIKTIICDFDREGVVPNKVLYLEKSENNYLIE